MATFDPSIPNTSTSAPEFINFSKPISPFELKADESGKIAAEGYGHIFAEGVDAADSTIKKGIEQEAFNRITPVTDNITEALEGSMAEIKSGLKPTLPTAKVASDASDNLLATPGADAQASANIPENIQQGLSSIDRLQNTLKLRPELKTLYSGQVAAIQKDMRANAGPGYRAYVDSEVSKVTGGVDANSHLRDLITQVAQAADQKNHFQQKIEDDLISVAKEQGDGDAFTYAQKLHNGEISIETAGQQLAKYNKSSWDLKQNEQRLNNDIKNRENVSQDAAQIARQYATDKMNDLFETAYTGAGTVSNVSLKQHLMDVSEGRAPNDPVKMNQYADMLESRKASSMDVVKKRLFQSPVDSDGNPIANQRSIGAMMSPTDFKVTMDQASSDYDDQIKLIRNGSFGLANTLHNNNMAMSQKAENNIRTDPRVGPIANNLPELQKLFGQNKDFQEFVTKNLMLPEVEKRFQGWFQDNAGAAMMGKVPVSAILQNGTQVGPVDPVTGKPRGIGPKTTNEVVNLSKYLGDPGTSPEFKESLAKSFYTPDNMGMLDNFKMDYTDDKGQTHAGKYGVYARVWSPNITNEMNKLRTTTPTGEGTWKNYVDSGEAQFYKVFRDDLSGMADLQETRGLKVKWDADRNELKFTYGQEPGAQDSAYYGRSKPGANTFLKQTETRVNNGLRSLGYMQKMNGTDTGEYMMNILKDSGVDLTKVDGVPSKIMEAIMKTRPLSVSPDEYKAKTGSKP